MMGQQSGQISMLILDINELIPKNHLLRKINQMISFDFIYGLVASHYPTNSWLVQENQLNIAYRWFCGYELGDKIPNHSTFSKTRVGK